MSNTRNLIDYAAQDDAVNFRSELYAALHDRVMAHIEAKKQEIAQSLVTQEEGVKHKAMKKEDETYHMKKEEVEVESLIEDFNMINEVSLGAKIRAYVHHSTTAYENGYYGNDAEAEHHEARAEKIHAHILKHHGPEAAKHAEKAAHSDIFGSEKKHRKGSDSLSGGLRGTLSHKVTKSGVIPKHTQSAMKTIAKGHYGPRSVSGPKGHLPEENMKEGR